MYPRYGGSSWGGVGGESGADVMSIRPTLGVYVIRKSGGMQVAVDDDSDDPFGDGVGTSTNDECRWVGYGRW